MVWTKEALFSLGNCKFYFRSITDYRIFFFFLVIHIFVTAEIIIILLEALLNGLVFK